jgi:hypothetical protein
MRSKNFAKCGGGGGGGGGGAGGGGGGDDDDDVVPEDNKTCCWYKVLTVFIMVKKFAVMSETKNWSIYSQHGHYCSLSYVT